MAIPIQAVRSYGPQIVLGDTVQKGELVEYVADRTGLNESEVGMVLTEVRDAVIFFTRRARGVKLDGLGTFLPSVKLSGRYRVSFRLDSTIKNALNAPGAFAGEVRNQENLGQTMDALIAQWNADHPGDPIP